MSKKFTLPWWERVRERGKVDEISHIAPFHPPTNPLPLREGECSSAPLHEAQGFKKIQVSDLNQSCL